MSKATILGSRTRPPATEIDYDPIPAALKLEHRWLGWQWKWKDDRWTKAPIGTSTDPATWVSFEEACARFELGVGDGIGFALGDGYCGLDLDDCRVDGELNAQAKAIIAELDTYTEVSPSGTGVKAIARGAKPGRRCQSKDGTVEMYDQGRYFCITGQRIHGDGIEDRQAELRAIHAQYINPPTGNQALDAARRILPGDSENDGSRRCYAIACRAVEHNLNDVEAVAMFREYQEESPFPNGFSDDDFLRRVRDAERQVIRGDVSRPLTDIGNAERFRDRHGNDVGYVHKWGKWFVWNGKQWAEDTAGEVVRRAGETARSIVADKVYDPKQREKLKKWAHSSEQNKAISALLNLAKAELPIAVESLDAKPWLLNCEDGTIDLKTGEIREHRREDFLTKCAPVKWSASEPELWLKFLREVLPDLVEFIQRVVGLCLVGEVVEHVLPIFYGKGANGKSVCISTFLGMLGDYAAKAPASLLVASRAKGHPTELAALHGRRLVAASETDEGIRLSEATVKEITGGEKISARRMREDFWDFVPSHTPILSTNHKPTITGGDDGIWRRVLLVPFSVTIPEDRQDKQLAAKLKEEWPAILHWAVQGCLDWQREGLNPPKCVTDATKDYRDDMDTLGAFVNETCDTSDGETETKASDLYAAYRTWAVHHGETPLTSTAFGLRIGERFKKHKNGCVYYRGVKCKESYKP